MGHLGNFLVSPNVTAILLDVMKNVTTEVVMVVVISQRQALGCLTLPVVVSIYPLSDSWLDSFMISLLRKINSRQGVALIKEVGLLVQNNQAGRS